MCVDDDNEADDDDVDDDNAASINIVTYTIP